MKQKSYRSQISRCCMSVLLWALVVLNPVAHADSQPLLWQVQDETSQTRLYLFGSLHYGSEKFYPLPDAVLEAFEKSGVLAVELDIEALDAERIRDLLSSHGYYSGEQNLRSQMSEQMWQQLKGVSEQLAVDLQKLVRFKPWMAAMQLTNVQLAQSGYKQSLGLDNYFLTTSRGKKTVLELESLEEQIELFAQLTEAEQLAFLQITLRDFPKGRESLDKLASAWYRGDEEELNKLVFSAFEKQQLGKKLYQLIFVERNKKMLAALEKHMKSLSTIFLVVGAGHMLGNDGLVALLEQKGYRVTRVSTTMIDEQ